MRKLLSTILIALGPALAMAQTAGPEISFDKEVHDYGTIEQHADGTCEFVVTNTGDQPLIISNCKRSCGCTVPKCPSEPIAPGKSKVIKVTYDTKRVGPISKSVTISSNAANAPVKVIRIKGQINAAPTAPVKEQTGPKAAGQH